MNVHTDLGKLPLFRNAVVTIGTFDGVHTGHQQIISQLKEEAAKIDGETIIVTFHPHPRRIIGTSSKEIKLINTLEEKMELLAGSGIGHLVIVPFTQAFAEMTAEEYIQDFLIKKFLPKTIIIGYDHRFGKDRKGDYHLLEDSSRTYHFRLKEIPVHVLQEVSVSSTRIRESITGGAIEVANQLLGYDFFFEGKIVAGNKLGRTIGFPTANLRIPDAEKIIPGDGVYAVACQLSGASDESAPLLEGFRPFQQFETKGWMGMMNIGNRPTIGDSEKTVEVNLFDFANDIYGKSLRVHVKKRLRSEQVFSGLEALKAQLAKDQAAARFFFKSRSA